MKTSGKTNAGIRKVPMDEITCRNINACTEFLSSKE